MKILVTLPKTNVSDTFLTPRVLEKLNSMGDVTFNPYDRHYTRDELKEAIHGIDLVLCGWGSTRYDAEILDAADSLKVICYCAGSVAGIASPEIYERGITLLSANCVFADSVAESCICYTMVGLRRIEKYSKLMRDGGWKDLDFYNEGIMDRTIGLVGFGTISQKFIQFLKPFRVRILVYSGHLTKEEADKWGVECATLEEIFKNSDVVSIHQSLTERTYHMIKGEHFKLMRDGALIINTARGAVIDEAAMIEELKTGRINAVLDVYEEEPLDPNSILRKLENVTCQPHMGGPTIDRRTYCSLQVLDDAQKLLAGANRESLESFIPLSHIANMTVEIKAKK